MDVCVGCVWIIGCMCGCMHVCARVSDFEFVRERDSACVYVCVCFCEREFFRLWTCVCGGGECLGICVCVRMCLRA